MTQDQRWFLQYNAVMDFMEKNHRRPSKFVDEERPPQKLLMQWIGQMQIVEGSYGVQCSRARELTALFAAKGYRSCVLIGPSFAVFFYCSYLFTLIIIYYFCSL